jgi:hypothetical protein
MAWVAPNQLLMLERSDRAGAGGVRLILIDLTNATDILGQYDGTTANPASGLALESTNRCVRGVEFHAADHVRRGFGNYGWRLSCRSQSNGGTLNN